MTQSKSVDGGWPLARRLHVAVAAVVAAFLLAGGALAFVLVQADRALSEQTQQTFPARLAASKLLTSLVDQETGLRGYALTGDEQFLGPYRRGLIDEQEARAELARHVRDDEARIALATVDAAITAWRDQYASLRIASAGGADTASTIEFGRVLFERVRQTNAALDAELSERLAEAQDEATRDRRIVIVAAVFMASLVALAVAALQRALRRSILTPMERLAAQVADVSSGAHRTAIEPFGPPEIRSTAAGVESMRNELVRALAEVESQRRDVERRAAELARSNADLEQFAYVASHDLQEPLRKVASFCQLLEQRYGGQLDEQADRYIHFAVDGAKRMQQLVSDLLTFSRVGRTSAGFVPLELATVIDRAWESLDTSVAESGGALDVDLAADARHILGDRSLVELLLTNLFGNALKYRRPDTSPRVLVQTTREQHLVRVRVADNGIGIPAEYADRVFIIFQRLHARDEYEGTGIGLALAKKVVEFHGGAIAVEPSPLGGTCLSFTLPADEDAP